MANQENINDYCEQHSSEEEIYLKEINRKTHLHHLSPRMLSGHLQGRILSLISKLIQPKAILEIGTFTGYSAICLAEGLAPDGKLITIENNPELEKTIIENIKLAKKENQIIPIIGDAKKEILALNETFDLVFIDADKMSYKTYYDLVFPKIPIGGIIMTDNVLWSGKVIDNTINDKKTVYIREFNRYLKEDSRTEKVILPIRDGIFISRKIKEL